MAEYTCGYMTECSFRRYWNQIFWSQRYTYTFNTLLGTTNFPQKEIVCQKLSISYLLLNNNPICDLKKTKQKTSKLNVYYIEPGRFDHLCYGKAAIHTRLATDTAAICSLTFLGQESPSVPSITWPSSPLFCGRSSADASLLHSHLHMPPSSPPPV